MAWVKIDDRYSDSKKIRRAWRRDEGAVGLHVIAMSHCALHETDGLVELDWLEERMPDPEHCKERLVRMVDLDLFEHLPAGEKATVKVTRIRKGDPVELKITHGPLTEDAYLVHDYLEYNEARQEAEERRRLEKERKTKARAKRPEGEPPESDRRPAGQPTDTPRTPPGVRAVSASSTRPDPTRPDHIPDTPPQPPSGGRQRDKDRYEQMLTTWAANRFPGVDVRAVVGLARMAIHRRAASWDDVAAYVEQQHTPARAVA